VTITSNRRRRVGAIAGAPSGAAYLPRILSAPSHSLLGSRSPSLASSMIALATAVVSGSPRSTNPSRLSAASNAAVKLATSSGPNAWSFSRITRIGTSNPNHTPHVRGNIFHVGGVCGGRLESGYRQNQLRQRLGMRPLRPGPWGTKQNPAEWPGRGPETHSHSGRGDAAEGPAIPIRSGVLALLWQIFRVHGIPKSLFL
jgi:hypothetical protein